MITDRSTLRDFRCDRGHVVQYHDAPSLCPFSGCGSRTFERANSAEAARWRASQSRRDPTVAIDTQR